MKNAFAPLAGILLLAACDAGSEVAAPVPATAGSDAEITQRLSGNRITVNNMILEIGPDGSLVGTLAGGGPIAGSWSIQNGQWCRTFVEPSSSAGTECQDLVVEEETMTVTTANGPQTWKFL